MLSNKPMHQTGALVLKEWMVFDRSQVSCSDQPTRRSLRSRLQVMGRSVMWRSESCCRIPKTGISTTGALICYHGANVFWTRH